MARGSWRDVDPNLPPVKFRRNKWHSSKCSVSVIMHCRGRPETFRVALQSLASSCSNISDVEILVKIDSNDEAGPQYLDVLKSFPFQHKLLTYDRLDAWWSVHIFETDLSKLANGDVLWLFNEDNTIVKGDWLRAFKESRNIYPDNIYVCKVPGMNPRRYKVVAPAYSKEWFNVMKIASPHVFSDRFLCSIAGGANRLLSSSLLEEIEFTHKKKEKVARPTMDLSKTTLTSILTQQIHEYLPIFKAAIVEAGGDPNYNPPPKVYPPSGKVYPPGTKVGPGYTDPIYPPGTKNWPWVY